MGFGGGSPEIPKPAPPPEPPVDDEEQQRKLAEQRKRLEGKRTGRQSLVIPKRNPGVSADTKGGMNA